MNDGNENGTTRLPIMEILPKSGLVYSERLMIIIFTIIWFWFNCTGQKSDQKNDILYIDKIKENWHY